MSDSRASRSTTLPFPSSPHCAPTITVAGTNSESARPTGLRKLPEACGTHRLTRGSLRTGSPGMRALPASAHERMQSRGDPRGIVMARGAGRISRGSEVRELRVAFEEGELLGAGGAVAMLGQEHLGEALVGRVVVVVLVPVDERDQVGVLLDRARLAQVGEDRTLVVSLLDGARELAHGQNRDVEVAREDLEVARDLGNLLDAILDAGARGHQLEVVD